MKKTYIVSWTIDCGQQFSPEAAAQYAWGAFRSMIAERIDYLNVTDQDGETVQIDMGEVE